MTLRLRNLLLGPLVFFALVLLACTSAFSQFNARHLPLNRYRGAEMLSNIKHDLKENYYDADFHGMKLDERFKIAEDKIEHAQSNGQIYAIIAQLLSELDDSHTVFLPPAWGLKVDYGFEMQTIGDRCYVTSVVPDSDAAKQQLKPGDQILTIDGFAATRANLWRIEYSYFLLQPRDGMTLNLRNPAGDAKTISLRMKMIAGEKLEKLYRKSQPLFQPRYHELNPEVMICKFPHFEFDNSEIEEMMKRIGNRKILIFDLRGNGGGLQRTMLHLLGYFFDREVNVATLQERMATTPLLSLPQRGKTFTGKLIVLVDSSSASAAEIFARTMQIQKRGVVIGDRTAGDVMISRAFVRGFRRPPADDWSFSMGYGARITIADCLMPDGKSLEHAGVIPDETLLPTPQDIAAERDPVLARAIELGGGHATPKDAASLFPAIK
jgi:carboxyl-terminal processing protease